MPLSSPHPRRRWLAWLALVLLLAGLHLAAWPLLWRAVLLPSLEPGREGLRLEARAGLEGWGPALRSWLAGPEGWRLDKAPARALAQGVWLAPPGGALGLRLMADDYAELYLDRRPLILQAPQVTALNQAESREAIAPGPHFIEVRLHNQEGQGWFRLLALGADGAWRPLGPGELHPLDLGNLPLWLGLANWLEGLSLWGLAGALLALPLLWLSGRPGRAARARRLLRGLAGLWLGLPLVLALARALPPEALPWLSAPYGADARLLVLGLGLYALAIGLGVGLAVKGWRARLVWWGLLVGLAASRILVWPYSMASGIHADYTSFEGFFHSFSDLFYTLDLERGFSLAGLGQYLWQLPQHLDVGYPSACFSLPALLLGLGGLAAHLALLGSGSALPFSRVGHLLGPACNLAYALLLAWTARRLIWRQPGQERPGGQAWSWLPVLWLWAVPTHIYLGGNITYNLLADALHLGFLLAALDFLAAWQDTLTGPAALAQGAGAQAAWPRLARPAGLTALLLGLCLATKLVFLPALVTLLLYAAFLMIRHGRARPRLALMALPLSLLACLLAGGVLYGLILLPSLLGVPGFWEQLLHMTGDNTGLSLRQASPWQCLARLLGDILAPNLGWAATLAGGLGLGLWAWRALASRDPLRLAALTWALLVVGLNLLSGQMLLAFNAMTRSTLILGLWLALALYLARAVWERLARDRGRVARGGLALGMALVLSLETWLAGASLLALYRDGAPRWRTEQYLRQAAQPPRRVAFLGYLAFADDPNTALGRTVYALPRGPERDLLASDAGCRRLLDETPADLWLLTSYDAWFFRSDRQAWRRVVPALQQDGYRLAARLEARPLAGHPGLEAVWRHFSGPLMADAQGGGLLEPAWVEVYARGMSSPTP